MSLQCKTTISVSIVFRSSLHMLLGADWPLAHITYGTLQKILCTLVAKICEPSRYPHQRSEKADGGDASSLAEAHDFQELQIIN